MGAQHAQTGGSVLDSRENVRQVLQRAGVLVAESHSGRSRSEETTVSPATSAAQSLIRAQLRASVSEYVRRLRDDGLPPEQALVQLKETVYAAGTLYPSSADSRDLIEQIVRWAVAAYYDSDPTE